MSAEPRNYELAYLLSPSIPEGEILTWAGKINMIVEEAKGVIRRQETPKKHLLAYPVNKEMNAYLGWLTFSVVPEAADGIKKKLRSLQHLLRYLLLEEEIEERPAFMRPFAPPRPLRGTARVFPKRAESKPEEKLDLEALDKKLEEILGK